MLIKIISAKTEQPKSQQTRDVEPMPMSFTDTSHYLILSLRVLANNKKAVGAFSVVTAFSV